MRVGVDNERAALDRWSAGVGPPSYRSETSDRTFYGPFAVVSWNTHVGAGDVDTLVADLRRASSPEPVTDFVLLLQEAIARAGTCRRSPASQWASAQKAVGVAREERASRSRAPSG